MLTERTSSGGAENSLFLSNFYFPGFLEKLQCNGKNALSKGK
jgi:hypothetical protein